MSNTGDAARSKTQLHDGGWKQNDEHEEDDNGIGNF